MSGPLAAALMLATAGSAVAAAEPPGALIELHAQAHHMGRSQRWSAPVADLARSGLGAPVASVTVWRGNWQLCADADHAGHCVVIGPGRYGEVVRWGLAGPLRSLRPTEAAPTPMPLPDALPR